MYQCPARCKHLAAAIAAVLILVGAACVTPGLRRFAATPTPALSPTPPPSLTPSRTPTPSPSPTATLTPTVTPTLIPMMLPKGPDVIYTGKNTEMKIFWQASAAETFQLEVGADMSYGLVSAPVNPASAPVNAGDAPENQASAPENQASAERFLYSVLISNLSPGTRYHYRLIQGQGVASGSFVTAPGGSAARLKFVSYGDTRHHPEAHNAVAGQVVELFTADPEYQTLNLMLGDLVDDGDEETAWNEQFFDPRFGNIRAMLANLAFMPVRGNHEESAALFGRYFPLRFAGKGRYLSFDYGPAHFTILDQYSDIDPGSAQYEWLVSDLAATQKRWKFVALHAPGWSARDRSNDFVRDHLQPLLEQYGVAVLFAGHDHLYSRAEVNGVQHITIGTGGAPLSDVVSGQPFVVAAYQGTGFGKFAIDGDLLTGWFIDSAGQVQDTFTIQR